MLTSALVLLASVAASSASRSLSVKVSAPSSVHNVDDFEISTTIVNTGDETVKLLKDPRGALSSWGTNTFLTTNEGGATAEFTGVAVRYVPSAIAKSENDKHFVVLAPGASTEVSHEVGRYYNFTAGGEGVWNFAPLNTFSVVESDGSLTSLVAETEAASTKITGNLASGRSLSEKSVGGRFETPKSVSGLSKRISYSGCSSTQQSQTSAAVTASKVLASAAVAELSANPSGSTLQTTWFGTYSSSRHSALQSAFVSLETVSSAWTYNCNTCASETDVYAYVYPSTYGYVYLCGYFWLAPATGSGSRSDTIIHEGSHFPQVKGTDDYTYGESSCKALAKSNPAEAANNADNLAFYSDYA